MTSGSNGDANRQRPKTKSARSMTGPSILSTRALPQLHPLVFPHVSHFSQVPFRTMVKLWHSEHSLPV